jgi:hypothetical protein
MCFGSKNDAEDQPAARPAKVAAPQSSNAAPPSSSQPPQDRKMDYAPPPGPPPSHQRQRPVGGPSSSNDDYAPPSGPPPNYGGSKGGNDDFAPPSGPPPGSHKKEAWEEAVPDTSLFPPPPDFFSGWDASPTNNATEEESEQGRIWCEQHPLVAPQQLAPQVLQQLAQHAIQPMAPQRGLQGEVVQLRPGVWAGRTNVLKSHDCTILGYPALYSVQAHSPLATGREKTIYYEVRILPDDAAQRALRPSAGHFFGRNQEPDKPDEVTLAMGFAALPYPPFRLPGWQRGSLAVHGDDGHRFVNDTWGGKSFTQPFRRGETYGIGMTIRRFDPNRMGLDGRPKTEKRSGPLEVEVFFTRGGRETGRWDLHEETDAQTDLTVVGLEGFHDLSVAVGTFNLMRYEVVFQPSEWMYKGVQGL